MKRCPIFFFLLLIVGCASIPSRVIWVPPVVSAQAAFLWKYRGGSLIGEAIITSDSQGNILIRLTKNLPRPLLEVTVTAQGKCHVRGPMSAGGWSGDVSRVPVRFRLWTALAEAWRGARWMPDGHREIHTPTYRAAIWKKSGHVRELSVSSTDSGEVVQLVFR